jgi:hypothetical protein
LQFRTLVVGHLRFRPALRIDRNTDRDPCQHAQASGHYK